MSPDRWLVLTVHIPAGASGSPASELLPDVLVGLGGRGVEEKGESFTTYLPPPEDREDLLRMARARIGELEIHGAELHWDWQSHDDWENLWRRGLGPRQITNRLVVAPSWQVPVVQEGQVLVVLDPGMAFGTAEHATTRACLRLMDSRVRGGTRIADVGSGSGILSIAAALLGAQEVLAIEGDPMACDTARENVAANGVEERVRILQEELRGSEPLPGGPYQGIVANIQSSILLSLLSTFRESLEEGGWVILSGILAEERGTILSGTSGHDLRLEEEDWDGEWWSGAFRLTRPRG